MIRSMLIVLFLFAVSMAFAQTVPNKANAGMFRKGYDIPAGVPHGTWDFDEWPGVDHPVVYKSDFMYNATSRERIKIDYFLSVFDKNDHEGYLKEPQELLDRGFLDLQTVLRAKQRNKTLLGIFCHPDDEVLLASGLLAAAAKAGWNVSVLLVSNGADGSAGQSDVPSDVLGGYNSFGVMKDGNVVVKTDKKGEEKLDIIRGYAQVLGVPIRVLPLSIQIGGKKVVQIGEAPGIDFSKTFGPGTEYREALRAALAAALREAAPAIVLTHGKDGEYGNYLHKLAHDIVLQEAAAMREGAALDVYTCFPEYNAQDKITHFIDLHADGRDAWNRKAATFKSIPFLFTEGADFDKPWDPNDSLMDGAFVKDYGYTPDTAEPPRYEFFRKVPSEQE